MNYFGLDSEDARTISKILVPLSDLPLMKLSLIGNDIRSIGVRRISGGLLDNQTLVHLNLSLNPISDKGIEHISSALPFWFDILINNLE